MKYIFLSAITAILFANIGMADDRNEASCREAISILIDKAVDDGFIRGTGVELGISANTPVVILSSAIDMSREIGVGSTRGITLRPGRLSNDISGQYRAIQTRGHESGTWETIRQMRINTITRRIETRNRTWNNDYLPVTSMDCFIQPATIVITGFDNRDQSFMSLAFSID
ncbi:MAG: hypothetical protein HRU19_23320 [Pseudobacteriovorax sp.]|nr:hypothetical protein [Pseudobacteriovorax sp.]